MTKKIIFVRHGKTKDEKLLKEQFKDYALSIAKYISLEKHSKKIHFVSSPLERCVNTAEMIISELNKLLNTNYKNNVDEKLSRWEKEKETREDSYERALKYRKEIKKIHNKLIVVISHSSMLPKLVLGSLKNKFNPDEYKELIKENNKLKHGYISVVNFDKDLKYNFKC